MNAPDEPCRRFLEALRARDFDALAATLHPALRFRALLPSGPLELTGANPTVARLRSWFAAAEDFEVLDTTLVAVGSRHRMAWRIRLRPAPFDIGPGAHVIEQQAFCDAAERIAALDVLCSGFLPEPELHAGRRQRFDAGTLGCGDGLPQEFRRRMRALRPGDVLDVVTADPAAKEDLPALARLLGHTVLSVEPSVDGRLTVTVEANR